MRAFFRCVFNGDDVAGYEVSADDGAEDVAWFEVEDEDEESGKALLVSDDVEARVTSLDGSCS